jgi:hypothetical protein
MSDKDIIKRFNESPDKPMFIEEFMRFELPRMLKVSGNRANALRVIFNQSASEFRHTERRDAELFNQTFSDLLSRFERVAKYRAPNGIWTITRQEEERIQEELVKRDKK